MTVGVLVRCRPGAPRAPELTPIGRAALLAEAAGLPTIVGDDLRGGVLRGLRAVPGGWRAASAPLVACYDRYPSRSRPDAFAARVEALEGVPLGNPPSLTALCRDKLRCQRHLEAAGIPMPPVEAIRSSFAARLEAWGAAFSKPRHGSFGRGVCHLRRGDALPPGADLLLQRAVPPPDGWASVCVRLLAQRTPSGWHLTPPVARRETRDPVANVARTSEVAPYPLAPPMERAAYAVCRALDRPHAVELGLDFAIDPAGVPWLIEVNGRPRGRLEHLARRWPERFAAAHREALLRPLRTLAAWVG